MIGRLPRLSPDTVGELVAESERLEIAMSRLQEEPPLSSSVVESCRGQYRQWFSMAKSYLSGEALDKFSIEDKGNFFSTGIREFLSNPRRESPLVDESGNHPLGRWQTPFDQVRLRLERQRQLLLDNAAVDDPMLSILEPLVGMLRRFPEFLRTLTTAETAGKICAPTISDEKQLQVVVEALLRLVFDDVRPEDYVSSRGGANSRVDFVLPEAGLVIEIKMTRASLNAAKLGEELLIDAGRYTRHPDCQAILAFVYDPERRLNNPRGLERDLTTTTADGRNFVCVISS